ncbi:TIR domain-containing protein [Streptomyces sp. NPDC059076]|uniref:TIR domain-containing protein n=1 Tax=unclassified Streptomyces TaxID=2593676 RepID=UPI0036931BC9
MDRSVNYFYTSCTRGDGWPDITRFHADLEYRLRVKEGRWVSGDLGGSTAADGPAAEAVAEVGVMIALYSPHFFTSPRCAFEWAVFQARIRRSELLARHDMSRCLITLLWKPVPEGTRPASVPEPEEAVHDGLGLAALMQSDTPESYDSYFHLIGRLAERITEARRTELPPFSTTDLADVQPEFGPASPGEAAEAGEPQTAQTAGTAETAEPGLPRRRTPWVVSADATQPGSTAQYVGFGSLPPLVPADPVVTAGSAFPTPLTVAVNYVGADQAWADWISSLLGEDGNAEVRQVRWEAGDESLGDSVARARSAAHRVVVIFSRSYFAARATEPLEWEDVFTGRDSERLIPVQIDEEPRPVLVRRGLRVLRLHGSADDEVRRLRAEVRDPSPRVPLPREGELW